MAFDIKLNPITNDIAFLKGEMYFTQERPESVTQRLNIKLKTFQEEWKFNVDFGVPYFQRIFQKGISKPVVDGIFRQLILDTEDVSRIIRYTSTIDSSREYTATCVVQAVDGTEITLSI